MLYPALVTPTLVETMRMRSRCRGEFRSSADETVYLPTPIYYHLMLAPSDSLSFCMAYKSRRPQNDSVAAKLYSAFVTRFVQKLIVVGVKTRGEGFKLQEASSELTRPLHADKCLTRKRRCHTSLPTAKCCSSRTSPSRAMSLLRTLPRPRLVNACCHSRRLYASKAPAAQNKTAAAAPDEDASQCCSPVGVDEVRVLKLY